MEIYQKEQAPQTRNPYLVKRTFLNNHTCFCDSYEAIFITKGELTIELNKVRYELKAGEGIIIFPNETYTLKTVGLAEKVSCLYSKDFIKDFDEVIQDDVEILNRQFAFDGSILPEDLDITKCNAYEIKSLIYYACGQIKWERRLKDTTSAITILKKRILAYIREHFNENISLKDVADELGYNYCYVSDKFHEIFGQGFTSFVNQYRLEQACDFLNHTDETVTNVGYICGFSSIRTFNRVFQEKYKQTPSEYRKAIYIRNNKVETCSQPC